MGDWALSNCERQEFSTAQASRGAANAKGSYVQLIAATGFAYNAISIQLEPDGGGGQCYLVDIAIGAAASEVVIVPNILMDSSRAEHMNGVNIKLPVAIPAGSRIAARCQEVGGAGTRLVNVAVSGRAGGSNYAPSGGAVVNYGANTSTTNGVLVDSGATLNTYGAWTEITSGTSADHNGLTAVLGTNQQSGTLVNSQYYFQIGIGAAASEVAIAEFISGMNTNNNRLHVNSADTLMSIPSGTRLAMRSKCVSSGAAAARHTTAILLGY